MSRSLRARGLKYQQQLRCLHVSPVALFTGAWIEIIFFGGVLQAIECRALYGRVD